MHLGANTAVTSGSVGDYHGNFRRQYQLDQARYSLNSSRSLFVWALLTGISVCFLSSIRIW
jgi:hypothetical protein